jgi:hypothetical protein
MYPVENSHRCRCNTMRRSMDKHLPAYEAVWCGHLQNKYFPSLAIALLCAGVELALFVCGGFDECLVLCLCAESSSEEASRKRSGCRGLMRLNAKPIRRGVVF